MTNWLPATLISLFSFGLWGLFTKLATIYIDSKSAILYQVFGMLLVGIVMAIFFPFKPTVNLKGLSFAMLTGLTYGIGCLFYFIAIDKGKLITVSTLTALYPLITIILSYFIFKETMTPLQWVGILCALLAIFLLNA